MSTRWARVKIGLSFSVPSFFRPYASLISCGGEAVVEPHLALVAVLAHLDADVAEAVELRAGLADLGGEKLVMIDELVVAERAAGRTTGNAQREGTRAEQRHALLIDAADLVDLAVLDPFRRVEDLRRRDVVGGAGLVVLAPFRGPPWLVDSLGHEVAVCACAAVIGASENLPCIAPASAAPAAPARPAVRSKVRRSVSAIPAFCSCCCLRP